MSGTALSIGSFLFQGAVSGSANSRIAKQGIKTAERSQEAIRSEQEFAEESSVINQLRFQEESRRLLAEFRVNLGGSLGQTDIEALLQSKRNQVIDARILQREAAFEQEQLGSEFDQSVEDEQTARKAKSKSYFGLFG